MKIRVLGPLLIGTIFWGVSASASGIQERGSLGPSVVGGPVIEFGFAHAAFTVQDLEASIAWYEKALGFHVLEYATLPGGTKAVQLINGSMHIELFQAEVAAGVPPGDSSPGIKHVAFLVKDVEAVAKELRARGVDIVSVSHLRDEIVADVMFIKDNSGNLIEFIQPLRGDPPFED